MKNVLIVGGGIAGISAAKALVGKANITLVESSSSVGGLLRSETESGFTFDMGTHVLRELDDKELNEILFKEIKKIEWNYFGNMHVGNYFNKSFYGNSQSIDIRTFSNEIKEDIISEIKSISTKEVDYSNAKSFITSRFGEIAYKIIYGPVLEYFFKEQGEKLDWKCAAIMGFSRIIAFNEDETKKYKEDPNLDKIFSFNNYFEGESGITNFYPNTGEGIGKYAESTVAYLKKNGVEILCDTTITQFQSNDNRLVLASLSNNNEIQFDEVIWTLPPSLLVRMTGGELSGKPPVMRRVRLLNYRFDKPFLIKNHFFFCYDPELYSYRVTLYPNLRKTGENDCTVEVVSNDEISDDALLEKVHAELISMNTISKDHQIKKSFVYSKASGFPTLTVEIAKNSAKLVSKLEDEFKNVHLTGKAKGKSFFMNDVMFEAIAAAKNIIKEK